MLRGTPLFLYKVHVRAILVFRCVLFSGCPREKVQSLLLVVNRGLRLCLALPKLAANVFLFFEALLNEEL